MKKFYLVVIGILAALIIGFTQHGNESKEGKDAADISVQIKKQKKAMHDLMRFGIAIGSYIADNGWAPKVDFYAVVRARFASWHIPVPPARDPWGHAYIYLKSKNDPKGYALGCTGSDGIFQGWAQSGGYAMEGLADFGQDIIYSNDEFTFAPKVEEGGGLHQEPELKKMDKGELVDKFYDLRIRQIEIDRLVRMLDDLDLGLKAIEAKVIRIELLKLEQRRVLKILENISSVIAPANSHAKRIMLKGDLLNLTVAVPLPVVIDQILRGLGSKGCFTQVKLVQKEGNTADSLGGIYAKISCRYNAGNVGPEPFVASASNRDYHAVQGQLSKKLKDLEMPRRLLQQQENNPENTIIESQAKEEIIRAMENIEKQIKKAESQEYRLAEIKKNKEELAGRIENMKGFLPDRRDMEKTRQELFSMIKGSGVVLTRSQTIPVKTYASHVEHSFAFSIKGDYPMLRLLFDQLASAKHLFILKEFELAENEKEPGTGRFRVDMIVSLNLYREKE